MVSVLGILSGIGILIDKRHIEDLYEHCQQEYHKKFRENLGENIFQDQIMSEDLGIQFSQNIHKKHQDVYEQVRRTKHFKSLQPLNVQDMSLFSSNLEQPMIFSELHLRKKQIPIQRIYNEDGPHIIVLVHGYQGSSYDMKSWRTNITLMYPKVVLLTSTVNEGEISEGDIDQMGQRLAQEVRLFVKNWSAKTGLGKLSFIAHSMGGLIVRAALPHLKLYAAQMYTFITLGTPHLGMSNVNHIINTGIWLMKKIKHCLSLSQLTMTDQKEKQQTLLYRMSKYEGLDWFENVILASSYQDQYIPFESARLQLKSGHNEDMLQNIMQDLNISRLYRLNVIFSIQGKSVDNMIGRTAHICFLDSVCFIKTFLSYFSSMF